METTGIHNAFMSFDPDRVQFLAARIADGRRAIESLKQPGAELLWIKVFLPPPMANEEVTIPTIGNAQRMVCDLVVAAHWTQIESDLKEIREIFKDGKEEGG